MMNRRSSITALLAFVAMLTLTGADALAQATSSLFAAGLKSPTRIVITPRGNLVVSEMGTGQNDGRISVIDQSGNRRTLVDGLPSAANAEGISGPTGLALRGRSLYVTIGEGDAILPGPVPGSLRPNFEPSSPLFSSVLEIRFESSIENAGSDFALTAADFEGLANGERLRAKNPEGRRLIVDVLVNFRNFEDEPRPDFPGNVRNSNPYGVAINGDRLYVVNAGLNLLREVDIVTGESRVVARFAPKPNPLPFGPPFVDAVPDSVRVFGRQVLVTLLTGFPFAPGLSEVRKINRANESQTTFIRGLTSAIDVLVVKGPNGQDQFYTLEISTNLLANAPGRLQFFSSANAIPVVIAGSLISPSSMARDELTGAIFITEIFTGRVIKVQVP
jgi:hypothetical protein